ncbi:hypothetical protein [Bradyrhizobium sp. BR 10289]|uniref:hypothetical protein n=1 Tax=Bradyrhizobium sp. BR 10289 TaxID=2749993 RepID=UPI001C6540E3|nr:hypothetical protein [Bradyrhizobium sp. BR 10289]MBW7969044.1 hypothetical protein [Bradyrhizobium sp. BR 10289]
MRVSFIAIVFALLAVSWPFTPAVAVPTNGSRSTWVSGTGNDANTATFCQRTAPCASFASALSVTLDGGVISCADPVSSNPFVISTSVTIDCTGTGAIVRAFAPDNGISINTAGIFVALRGLTINSSDIVLGVAGISVSAGAIVQIEQCKFADFNFNSAIAVNFIPSSGSGHLIINDSTIFHSGSNSVGGGIVIKPQGTANSRVTINRVVVAGGLFGIAVDGSNSTGGVNMTIADSVLASNVNDGVVATTSVGGAPIGVTVINTKTVNNGFGVRSIGNNVTVRLERSTVVGNVTGLAALSGGALTTAGNNIVEANASNGSFSGTISFK